MTAEQWLLVKARGANTRMTHIKNVKIQPSVLPFGTLMALNEPRLSKLMQTAEAHRGYHAGNFERLNSAEDKTSVNLCFGKVQKCTISLP